MLQHLFLSLKADGEHITTTTPQMLIYNTQIIIFPCLMCRVDSASLWDHWATITLQEKQKDEIDIESEGVNELLSLCFTLLLTTFILLELWSGDPVQ